MFKPKKSVILAALLAGVVSMGNLGDVTAAPASSVTSTTMKNSSISNLNNDTRVFKVDKSIQTKFVTFRNRYGVDVAGHLYLPKNFDANKKYATIVVSGAFGAVKEQHSGLYAQEFAKAGFVAVAFDPSFTGESGGNVRDVGSPEIFTEDFSAAVDFVGSLAYVDRIDKLPTPKGGGFYYQQPKLLMKAKSDKVSSNGCCPNHFLYCKFFTKSADFTPAQLPFKF